MRERTVDIAYSRIYTVACECVLCALWWFVALMWISRTMGVLCEPNSTECVQILHIQKFSTNKSDNLKSTPTILCCSLLIIAYKVQKDIVLLSLSSAATVAEAKSGSNNKWIWKQNRKIRTQCRTSLFLFLLRALLMGIFFLLLKVVRKMRIKALGALCVCVIALRMMIITNLILFNFLMSFFEIRPKRWIHVKLVPGRVLQRWFSVECINRATTIQV